MSAGAFFYDFAKDSFATKQINWLADTIEVLLVDTSLYTVNQATDQYLSAIPIGARIAQQPLTGKTVGGGGVLGGDDTPFTGVIGNGGAVVLYQDTGVAGTSILIIYTDCAGGLPFSFGGSGADFTVHWDSNVLRKIGKL